MCVFFSHFDFLFYKSENITLSIFPSSCTRAKVNPVMHLSTWRWARWSRSLLHTYACEKHNTHDLDTKRELWRCQKYQEGSSQNLNTYVVSTESTLFNVNMCILLGREQAACTYHSRVRTWRFIDFLAMEYIILYRFWLHFVSMTSFSR